MDEKDFDFGELDIESKTFANKKSLSACPTG